tara:strand:+ start:271 stop:777 length:507 start_codon:yes stop_codon:yes gene_type:complete
MDHSRILYDKIRLEAPWTSKPSWEIDAEIAARVCDKYGDKCNADGFVHKHSIFVTDRSAGMLDSLIVDGSAIYEVVFVATICAPKRGEVINCVVIDKNNEGVQCHPAGRRLPLDIVMPIEWHVDPSTINYLRKILQVGDHIQAEIIGKRFQPGDRSIRLVIQFLKKLD